MSIQLRPMTLPPDPEGDTARERAIAQFRELYADGEVLYFATSFGKDSTTTLNLGIEAALREQAAGRPVPPIIVHHSDTTVENPAVRAYADRMIEHMERFRERTGLDIRVQVAQPLLKAQWPVQILSGRRKPVFANSSSRTCSVDYKKAPSDRLRSRLRDGLREEGFAEMPITVLGTRFDESAGRQARMRDRGEGAHVNDIYENEEEPRGKRIDRTFAPIAEWTTDNVWEYLANAGNERAYASFAPHFDETVEVYKDAMGECVIVGAAKGPKSSACGARHGCWACTVSGATDKSMENMLVQPQHAYMQGLNDLRNWLEATQADYSLRRWIKREDPDITGHITIIPGDYSADTTRFLLSVMLSLDAQERERAAVFREAVAAGRVDDDPGVRAIRAEGSSPAVEARVARYVEDMQTPRFHLITPEILVAIDYTWSVDALHPPFEAMRVYDEVVRQAQRVFAPVFPERRKDKVPPKLYHPVQPLPGTPVGIHGAATELALGEFNDLYQVVHPEGPDVRVDGKPVNNRPLLEAERRAALPYSESFEVDPEGAAMFLEFEIDYALKVNADFHAGHNPFLSRTEAALTYSRMGILSVNNVATTEMMIRRGQWWEQNGLAGDVPIETIRSRCIDETQHAALLAQAEAAQAERETREREERERAAAAHGAEQMRRHPEYGANAAVIRDAQERIEDEVPYLLAKKIAYESALASGLTRSDGRDLDVERKLMDRTLAEFRALAKGEHALHLLPLLKRVEAEVHERAAELLTKDPWNAERFAWGFGIELSYHDAEERGEVHRKTAATLRREADREESRMAPWRPSQSGVPVPVSEAEPKRPVADPVDAFDDLDRFFRATRVDGPRLAS